MIGKVTLVYTEKHMLHRDPEGSHPESPWRVEEIVRAVEESELANEVAFAEPPGPNYSSVLLAHEEDYVEWIKKECAKGFHYVDSDTYVNEYTCDLSASFAESSRLAALEALGGAVTVILARPGGHHAGLRGRAMGAPTLGFCVFDYASVAALELVERGYRVVVLDFDAHHGNGTQEILWSEPMVLHIDIHQWQIYPGTGWVTDTGGTQAEGSKINIPLMRGAGDGEFAWVLENVVKPAVEMFKPDVVVVFAGFDGHVEDPLTGLAASEATFALYGRYLRELLEKDRISGAVIILGGGYGPGLVKGFTHFMNALLGSVDPPRVPHKPPGLHVEEAVPVLMKKLGALLEGLKS